VAFRNSLISSSCVVGCLIAPSYMQDNQW
jgi:hypothetical protein